MLVVTLLTEKKSSGAGCDRIEHRHVNIGELFEKLVIQCYHDVIKCYHADVWVGHLP